MGGGQGQASATSRFNVRELNAWDTPWESDADELVATSDCSESPVLVDFHKGTSSECEPQRKDEVPGLASPCLTSAAPNNEKDRVHLELRRRLSQNGEALATRGIVPQTRLQSIEARLQIIEARLQNVEAPATGEIIRQTRGKLNRYMPGSSIVKAERKNRGDYVIPEKTTLLIVGLKGAGKSSLINNMIRVLRNKPTGFYRAHVSDDPSEYGTYFMEEHLICGGSRSPKVSLFDTRGLPEDDTSTAMALLEGWMKDGVRHGQMDLRASDSSSTKQSIWKRGRLGDHQFSRKKNVNFVIFVVDAVAVIKMKESGDDNKRAELVQLYKNPYLTFKDDRPVVVMTHGDKLSHDDRISAHLYLGEIFGVHPVEQIFDISGLNLGWTGTTISNKTGNEGDIVRDITLLKMLTFALDCADRNLPYKKSSVASLKEVFKSMAVNYEALECDRKLALCGMIISIYLLLVLFITACVSLSLSFKKRKW